MVIFAAEFNTCVPCITYKEVSQINISLHIQILLIKKQQGNSFLSPRGRPLTIRIFSALFIMADLSFDSGSFCSLDGPKSFKYRRI